MGLLQRLGRLMPGGYAVGVVTPVGCDAADPSVYWHTLPANASAPGLTIWTCSALLARSAEHCSQPARQEGRPALPRRHPRHWEPPQDTGVPDSTGGALLSG